MKLPIRTGLCSYGMSGKIFHAPFIKVHPGYELTAIVERSKNDSNEKYPGAKILRSVDELIADPEISLVVVNTPLQTHYEFTKAALLAGKHVITEKPFTLSSKQAEELNGIAEDSSLLLSVYQ